MLLHLDGSRHRWFQDERWHDFLVIVDDATTENYYAQLVEEESTRTVMVALKDVVERKGLCCALYSDRASHFFETPKAGQKVDLDRLTQVGRAMKELGIQMIPAYSPQARGRSERNFGTRTVEEANRFLREQYIGEFNRRFAVPAVESGTAFVPARRGDLDRVFSLQHERVVNRDNTVQLDQRVWQIERRFGAERWRGAA